MILPKNIMREIKPANSVSEILNAGSAEEFIGTAYLTLLNRLPDEEGYAYYFGRLEAGSDYKSVLAQIASSAEAKRAAVPLKGLTWLLNLYAVKKIFKSGRGGGNGTSVVAGNLPVFVSAKEGSKSAWYERVCMKANYVSQEIYDRNLSLQQKAAQNARVWFDLTTSLEWDGGVVGIIRAELEVAAGLKRLYPGIRFVTLLGNGFVEVPHSELDWLFAADNVCEAYLKHFAKDKKSGKRAAYVNLCIPEERALYHPFAKGDAIIAMGWMGSEKEKYYSRVKRTVKDIYINYLIYDTILLNDETRRFYPVDAKERFRNYLKWVSEHADLILFGGQTAKNDTEKVLQQEGWPMRPGLPVKFGTDIVKTMVRGDEQKTLETLGINGDFILTVGSIEPRKNHDTLYRAYLYALGQGDMDLPQLVICGKPIWRTDNLLDALSRDPRVQGKIIHLVPSDQELALLYKRCLFTVLPSLYEGWSLTLPESLGQGKFCLASDNPPLREIGKELIDYVDGWDVRGWAEKISYYASRKDVLGEYEEKIARLWPSCSWEDSAKSIYEGVVEYMENNEPRDNGVEIWIDLTISYLYWRGGISGIVRAELTFARNIYKIYGNVHFFAFDQGNFFEIDKSYLLWLLNDLDLAAQYSMFQKYWADIESAGTGHRNPFHNGVYPGHPSIMQEFPEEAIFLFLSIDTSSGYHSRNRRITEISQFYPGLFKAQLIYDFTPVLFPHLHEETTCAGYLPFLEFVYNNFDFLSFGGKTAMMDGEKLRSASDWKNPPSGYIEFGSDIGRQGRALDSVESKNILKSLGVTRKYVMTVGTIEPRKNHEMLYKAMLTLRARDFEELPQLVIVGKPGWKTEDFRGIFELDDRVKDMILILSPNDEELEVLYRNCCFTLLASFYEGWSLTLPESLNYGKFCLTSDVAPLREVGRDLVEYIDPLDTMAWADRISFYLENPKELLEKEKKIRSEWKSKTWKDCSEDLLRQVFEAYAAKYEGKKLNV